MGHYPLDLKTTTRRMILTAIHIKWVNPIYKLFYIKIKETYIKLNPKYCSKHKTQISQSSSLKISPSRHPHGKPSKHCEFSSSPLPPPSYSHWKSHTTLGFCFNGASFQIPQWSFVSDLWWIRFRSVIALFLHAFFQFDLF